VAYSKYAFVITITLSCLVWWLEPVILVIWEVESRRTEVQSQFGQKAPQTPSQPMTGHSSTHLSINGRMVVQARSDIKQDPISKITYTERTGRLAQVRERLPSKYETKFNVQYCKKKKKITLS
jgi:hypothetical protein